MRVARSHFIPEEPTIRRGNLVRPKFLAKFGTGGGNWIQVGPGDLGIVVKVVNVAEVECLFRGRPTWWAEEELEVMDDD